MSSDGLGPLVLGTPYSAILGQGLVVATPTGECRPWDVSPALAADGVSVDFSGSTFTDRLIQVSVHTSKYATVSGARVGMTLHQIQGIYGTRLVIETKEGDGGPFEAAVVRAGGREVAFLFPWDIGAIDTAPVQTIVSRDWSTEMHGGC
jgi:hypothetical protein